MSDLLFLDTNSMTYAYQAGGAELLNRYASYAKGAGYEIAITDVVGEEIRQGPVGEELTKWFADQKIRV